MTIDTKRDYDYVRKFLKNYYKNNKIILIIHTAIFSNIVKIILENF